MKYETCNCAKDLPKEWDGLDKNNPYLARDFLAFIEKTEKDYNPVYHLFYDGDRLDSCFISFKRKKYNVAMFTPINFYISVTLIYLPMCVTRGGFYFGKLKKEVIETIKKIKGYKMLLNADDDNSFGVTSGLTCPKCALVLKWNSFDDYLSALRSDYRNRVKKVFKRSKDLVVRFINPNEFTDENYQTYLNVLNKSKVKIETLSKEYFMSERFKIFVLEKDGKSVGFVQLLPSGDELIFEFVGINYDFNDRYSVYHRALFEIIRYGIENGYKTIDFGQTADDTKLKLGCKYVYLYAYFHHSNKIINYFCKKFGKKLEYKPLTTKFNVFRDDL